jgi:DNA replication ATP-dependent helicase Dna2
LYDLIIKSVYKGRKKTSNYILYSKEEEWQLRNAPVLKIQQYEALKTRNDLLLIEYLLSQVDNSEHGNNVLMGIKPASFPKAKGFLKTHVQEFYDLFKGLSQVEQAYMTVFTRFIAREHRLAKVGEHGLSKANGLAALWLEESTEKEDRFSILHSLRIKDNQSSSDVPVIMLSKTSNSPELSRFREGDIVVLYPQAGSRSVLHNQIFKCNIIGIDDEGLTLKLRSRQYNQRIFNDNDLWAIEGDVMDSSFLSMYRSLYSWATGNDKTKSLTLGLEPPEKSSGLYEYHSDEMTEEQNLLLNHIIHTRDYYLLWGPPGTGKTSIMIKHLVKYLYNYTSERIVLVAYTNRAVDEICEAVIQALGGVKDPFIRIGSSHSCGSDYRSYLLDQQVAELKSRKEILNLLKSHRVIVSTVSSIVNRVEIFHLYNFDTIIIDEASQILEPMIVGLLSKFKRFIMIGDHKQLPAVVVQPQSHTEVKDEVLRAIGFTNTGTSLFERLYTRSVQQGWSHAYGILSQQGRMHRDLMSYPNTYFYEKKLDVIKGIERLVDARVLPLPQEADKRLWKNRMTYIPTPIDENFSWKTNTMEADVVINIVRELKKVYDYNGLDWGTGTCGIITPYRAQIAMIRKKLIDELDKELTETITVDTVERYQGGARDIIIISLCTNRLDQMERLVSLSDEGIDRKLNVALTRARERIFVLGNKEVLQNDANYSRLIDLAYTVSSSS